MGRRCQHNHAVTQGKLQMSLNYECLTNYQCFPIACEGSATVVSLIESHWNDFEWCQPAPLASHKCLWEMSACTFGITQMPLSDASLCLWHQTNAFEWCHPVPLASYKCLWVMSACTFGITQMPLSDASLCLWHHTNAFEWCQLEGPGLRLHARLHVLREYMLNVFRVHVFHVPRSTLLFLLKKVDNARLLESD